jgi:hypothetical protein
MVPSQSITQQTSFPRMLQFPERNVRMNETNFPQYATVYNCPYLIYRLDYGEILTFRDVCSGRIAILGCDCSSFFRFKENIFVSMSVQAIFFSTKKLNFLTLSIHDILGLEIELL